MQKENTLISGKELGEGQLDLEKETAEKKLPGSCRQIALYGAGMVAVSVYYAIKMLDTSCRITCFIVSEKEGNPSCIEGIPILSIDEFHREQETIVIAAPENHHKAITARLEERGIMDYLCVDSDREAALMERYYEAIGDFPTLRSYRVSAEGGGMDGGLKICMARFHKDIPLENPYEPPSWIYPVQAGASLTDKRIGGLRDDLGDNISEKNGNYSELTAMYWMWKHREKLDCREDRESKEAYLGLFHYRRILNFSEEDYLRVREHEIDVILPYPTIHAVSIHEHHRRYVTDSDWKAMTVAVRELAPEYAKVMEKIFSQPYFYNYNMFIARERIFDDFCSWMFPILERTEELSIPKGWERSDRYIGYLGENLVTLYFLYHRHEYRIAHTGRRILL